MPMIAFDAESMPVARCWHCREWTTKAIATVCRICDKWVCPQCKDLKRRCPEAGRT